MKGIIPASTKLIIGLLLFVPITTTAASNLSPVTADNNILAPEVKTGDKKILLIGIDGLQLAELRKVNTPNFDRLIIKKAYAGGIAGTSSEQMTSSGSGWSTILTGVWANKHHITSNSSDLANPEFSSLFKRLRDNSPSAKIASVMNWGTPNTSYFRNDVIGNDLNLSGLSDNAVIDKGIELVQQEYDLIFLHLDDPDHAGHASGFGLAYDKSIKKTDSYIGKILDEVEQSRHDWLVLLTTDHGRQAITGYSHGNQTKQEKTIFIGSNKPLNTEFNAVATGLDNDDFDNIYGYPAQTSLTPTALRYLGVEPQKEWRLDGIPLTADVGVRKLMAARSGSQDVVWFADASANVDVYRNGELVTQVDALQQGWSDDAEVSGIIDYVLVKNNTPAALRINKAQINAAVSWDAFRAHFFRDDQRYVRYAKVTDKADRGYPKATDNNNWPGFNQNADKLVAAFENSSGTSYYFFSDGQYIRYNNILDRAESGYPKAIDDQTWPGLGSYAHQITATLRWTSDKVFFFLKNGQYLRFDLGDNKVDPGYPKPINEQTWPGLGDYAADITAAVKWNSNSAYIFLNKHRYIRYNITDDRADPGYPAKVNEGNWPGLMAP
jgi:hypothetical protein